MTMRAMYRNYALQAVAVMMSVFAIIPQKTLAADKAQSKARIDKLLMRIEQEAGARSNARLQLGEQLGVTLYTDSQAPQISLQDNIIYFGVNNCKNVNEFKSWSFLQFPLRVETDVNIDARSPSSNLKHLLLKNAVLVKDGASSQCYSHLDVRPNFLYKISAAKVIGGKTQWFFEKKFAEDADYYVLNQPRGVVKNISSESLICNYSARICYSNRRKAKYVSHLTAAGPTGFDEASGDENKFYLQTRYVESEVAARFPKFKVRAITPTRSHIAKYIIENLDHTIVVSVRDNAMRHLKGSDLAELKAVGVDLSDLAVRGAHISILEPGKTPVNKTNNKGVISINADEHKIPYLGTILSAGFSAGDHSIISVLGENLSPNYRGLNVVVINSEGKLISARNFDTHSSAQRTQGIFELSLK